MTSSFNSTQARIEGGVLRIDNNVYPLRNISHVGTDVLPPPVSRAGAWTKFVLGTLLCLVAWAILSSFSTTVGVVVALGGMLVLVWRLVSALKLGTIYGLVLNTSGVQQHALWSTSESEIADLADAITEAISHPDTAQYIQNFNNIVSGDVVQQYGSGNVGKQVHAR